MLFKDKGLALHITTDSVFVHCVDQHILLACISFPQIIFFLHQGKYYLFSQV